MFTFRKRRTRFACSFIQELRSRPIGRITRQVVAKSRKSVDPVLWIGWIMIVGMWEPIRRESMRNRESAPPRIISSHWASFPVGSITFRERDSMFAPVIVYCMWPPGEHSNNSFFDVDEMIWFSQFPMLSRTSDWWALQKWEGRDVSFREHVCIMKQFRTRDL